MKHGLLLALAIFCLSLGPITQAAQGLPLAKNLQADARQTQAAGIPILIFYSAAWCEYCEQVSDLYLLPMFHGGSYQDRLLFRLVDIGSRQSMRDFQGRRVTQRDFAHAQGVGFTPIVRLYDGQGKELVPELHGYSSPDFYAALLEQAIAQAQDKLHKR